MGYNTAFVTDTLLNDGDPALALCSLQTHDVNCYHSDSDTMKGTLFESGIISDISSHPFLL